MRRQEKSQFELGAVFITPGALKALEEAGQSPWEFLRRHRAGDWGELCEEDKEENEFSLREGLRILSAYHTRKGREDLGDHRSRSLSDHPAPAGRVLSP